MIGMLSSLPYHRHACLISLFLKLIYKLIKDIAVQGTSLIKIIIFAVYFLEFIGFHSLSFFLHSHPCQSEVNIWHYNVFAKIWFYSNSFVFIKWNMWGFFHNFKELLLYYFRRVIFHIYLWDSLLVSNPSPLYYYWCIVVVNSSSISSSRVTREPYLNDT